MSGNLASGGNELISCLYDRGVEKKIESFEIHMVQEWNGRGEPWGVFDPDNGDKLAEGLGVIVLRCGKPYTYCKNVTYLFEELTASELGLEDLTKMTESWLGEHTAGGDCEHIFDDKTKSRLDEILTTLENACKESGLGLRLCHEADVLSRVEEDKLKGKIVTHFHPNGKPPTEQDKNNFENWELLELRTVTEEGVYITNRLNNMTNTTFSGFVS